MTDAAQNHHMSLECIIKSLCEMKVMHLYHKFIITLDPGCPGSPLGPNGPSLPGDPCNNEYVLSKNHSIYQEKV